METDKFLDEFKNSLADEIAGWGATEGERRFVKHFSTDELVQNLKEQEDELGGSLSGLTKEEYIPIRNKVFDTAFGTGFAEQYDRHPLVGQGGFGTVFEKPSDPSRVLKVQRLDHDTDRTKADYEVERQLEAAELGLAPRIHAVETAPSSYQHRNSNWNSTLHTIEMDRVPTENVERGNREQALALSKARLKLASQTGIVHDDLNTPYGRREDHMSYDPVNKSMSFIDYGKTEQYDHAQDLHDHDKYGREFNKATGRAEHFLDHKVDAIYDGMTAVGNQEEATIFYETYKALKDKDLRAASDLVDQGESLINRHTMDDTVLTKVDKEGHKYEINNPTASDFLRDFI